MSHFIGELVAKAKTILITFWNGKPITLTASLMQAMLLSFLHMSIVLMESLFAGLTMNSLNDSIPMNHSCLDPLQTTPLYMYALLAVVLCCPLDCEAMAIDTRMAQQIQLYGKDYSPIYEEYFLALSKVMASNSTASNVILCLNGLSSWTWTDPTVGTSSSQGDYAGFQMYNSAIRDTAEPEACNFDYNYDYNL
ncbi:hypothetical protein EV363DRAFT_1297745 [Boletus edulis]|nr:hypothetical protein EV363DRAFT_1297745 [Boletus edulis]